MKRTLSSSLIVILAIALSSCATTQSEPAPQVASSIMVTSPNGGETWAKGGRYNIRWKSEHISDHVLIRLLRMDRNDVYEVEAQAQNIGRYNYTVLGNIPVGRYKVSIKDSRGTVEDRSDKDFEIVLPKVNLVCRIDTRIGVIGEAQFRRSVLQYKILVKNKGTKRLKDVFYKSVIIKQPENVVLKQDGGSFDYMHPNKWYSSGWLTDYGNKGQHRIEAHIDTDNLHAEVAPLRIDNICFAEGASD